MRSTWESQLEVPVRFSENLATREEIEAVYQQITGKDQEERKK